MKFQVNVRHKIKYECIFTVANKCLIKTCKRFHCNEFFFKRTYLGKEDKAIFRVKHVKHVLHETVMPKIKT